MSIKTTAAITAPTITSVMNKLSEADRDVLYRSMCSIFVLGLMLGALISSFAVLARL